MDKSKKQSFVSELIGLPEWDIWTMKSKVKAVYEALSLLALITMAMGPIWIVALAAINSVVATKVAKTIPNMTDDDD